MQELSLQPGDVAERAKTTEVTVHNWLRDKVRPDHVKAAQLFNIADAVRMDPRVLLLGDRAAALAVREAGSSYESQPMKQDLATLAFQLAAEVDAAMRKQGRTLPPSKQGELAMLAYDLLDEGLPQAKVLRFVVAAAA